jgi:hypothetical protein
MRRAGDLWPRVTCFVNLMEAALAAAAGKRRRPDVARFLLDLEPELVRLRQELENDSYQPGPYRSFLMRDPKPRLISAAPFRDRVVHHALTRVVEPIYEARFSECSFACRRGFGNCGEEVRQGSAISASESCTRRGSICRVKQQERSGPVVASRRNLAGARLSRVSPECGASARSGAPALRRCTRPSSRGQRGRRSWMPRWRCRRPPAAT